MIRNPASQGLVIRARACAKVTILKGGFETRRLNQQQEEPEREEQHDRISQNTHRGSVCSHWVHVAVSSSADVH